MPWYSAPARLAAATYRRSSSRTGANLSPASMCCPPPGREPPGAVLREQGVTRKLARRGPPLRRARAGRRLASCCRQGSWPPLGSTSTPCPCHESRRSSGEAPSHRPCPNRPRSSASVADRSSGPAAATPSAVPLPPGHMPPSHLSAGTSPRRSPRSARCRPVTPTGRDLHHIGQLLERVRRSAHHGRWPGPARAAQLPSTRKALLPLTGAAARVRSAAREQMPRTCRPSDVQARWRTKQRTLYGIAGCVRPILLPLLHDFPDPGKYHRFPCSVPRTRGNTP